MKADLNRELFEKALWTLYQEAYVGPPDPKATWMISNAPDAGILGTLAQIPVTAAFAHPHGLSHSIAEHAAHLAFALRTALQYAKGNFIKVDWKTSWNPGESNGESGANRWPTLQAELRSAYDALIDFGKTGESFDQYESIAGFIGQIAHGTYHLGAIRQLTQLTAVPLAPEASASAPK